MLQRLLTRGNNASGGVTARISVKYDVNSITDSWSLTKNIDTVSSLQMETSLVEMRK